MRVFLLAIGFSWIGLNAQQVNLDSLWGVWIDTQQPDTSRLNAIKTMTYSGMAYSEPDSAIKLAQLHYDLAEKTNNFYHMSKARSTQGVSSFIMGEFDNSILYYTESIRLEEGLGNQNGVCQSILNLCMTYKAQCDYENVINWSIKGLALCESSNNTSGVGKFYSQLGSVYTAQGMYKDAVIYYEKSLVISRQVSNKRDESSILHGLGNLYYTMGLYEQASNYFHQSLEIRYELNNQHLTATTLNGLGSVSFVREDYPKALEYTMQASRYFEMVGHKAYFANTLNNIGLIYNKLGDQQEAYRHYEKAYRIYEDIGAKSGMANALYNISKYHWIEGELDSAISVATNSYHLGKEMNNNLVTRQALQVLYYFNVSNKNKDTLESLTTELTSLRLKDLSHNFSVLTESQKETYFAAMQEDFDIQYSFSNQFESRLSSAGTCYNIALKTKGLLLRSGTAQRNTILNSGDSVLVLQYRNWMTLKRRIANGYSIGEEVSDLISEADDLESIMLKNSDILLNSKRFQELTWNDIQSSLKEGESAIEFVRFTHREDYRNDSNMVQLYAALIIDKNSEHPKMVRLFEEPELEKILGSFPGNNLSYIEQIYGTKENTKSQLYDLIWKPMEEAIGDAKKVYVSPVGLLHKISFAALAKEQDVYLCDLYDIEIKSSTGKIALPDNVAYNENMTTTLFGGIDYNSDSTSTEIWNYLDGSLSETQQISKILKKGKVYYNYFIQGEATEAQFKEMASKSHILHIATHGFFYPDPDLALEEMIDVHETEEPINFRGGRQGVGVNTFVKSRNPLMRSGLAFAGANDVWNRTEIDGEDGVLTAAEVATIDMRNTELVVLSACETGLGDIKGSEGVYGLQRSFKMAGVKYIIMSLWQVPDKETAEFMTTFYKYLTKTKDIKSSFNQTQKDMRKKYDPYYWAAFVLIE